jgi:hypothetical protein
VSESNREAPIQLRGEARVGNALGATLPRMVAAPKYVSASPVPRQAHHPGGRAEACIYRRRGDGAGRASGVGLPQPLDEMPYALAVAGGGPYPGLRDGRLSTIRTEAGSWRPPAPRGDPLPRARALACAAETLA